MFSRSAAVVARGRALSPLSPLSLFSLPGLEAAKSSQRNRSLRSGNKVGRSFGTMSTVNVIPPSEGAGSPLPSATSFGLDSTMMERLQAVLASPFSPGTFVRSMFTEEDGLGTASISDRMVETSPNVPALKPRSKKRPDPLPLGQPTRLSLTSPLSPFHYGIMAARLVSIKICSSCFLTC